MCLDLILCLLPELPLKDSLILEPDLNKTRYIWIFLYFQLLRSLILELTLLWKQRSKVLSIFGQDRWLTSSWLHLSQRKFWCTSYLGKAFVATIRFYLFVCVNVWPGRYHFSWAENLVIDEGQSPQNKIGLCRPCANLGDRSCFFTQTQSPSVFRLFSVWQPPIANLFSCFIYPTAIGADEW